MAELRKMKDANTGFESSTGGKMFFDPQQDAPAVYDVVNLNGDSWINVGSYDPSPDQGLRIKKKIVWPGGSLVAPPSTYQPRCAKCSLITLQSVLRVPYDNVLGPGCSKAD